MNLNVAIKTLMLHVSASAFIAGRREAVRQARPVPLLVFVFRERFVLITALGTGCNYINYKDVIHRFRIDTCRL